MTRSKFELADGQLQISRSGEHGRLGVITLNRPRQLNALSIAMIHALVDLVAEWRDDASVEQLVLVGAGERGLSSGGDIVELRQRLLEEGNIEPAIDVLSAEYRLDATWGELPQPMVAVMDGITMGGGVGLSGHTGIRIATERSQIGMPEAAIGFVPDVGGSRLLANMPGRIGEHAGVTGLRLNAADAIATGFADHFIPSERIPLLLERLESEPALDVVADLAEDPGPSQLLAEREWIDEVYSADTLHEVVSRLQEVAPHRPAAATALAAISTASPLGVAATFELVRRSRAAGSLRASIDLEFRAGMRLLERPDFSEGVRAALVDKDQQPRWQPARLDDVTDDLVAGLFSEDNGYELDWTHGPLGLR